MCKYEDLITNLSIQNNSENKKIIKAIVHSLINNNQAIVEKQSIDLNYDLFEHIYNQLIELEDFFDYSYSTKIDLTKFIDYILSQRDLNINAIFCPGYTSDGYKDYIGKNNKNRLADLRRLKDKLIQLNIPTNINIELADIFLENTDSKRNELWREELEVHRIKFIKEASLHFSKENIIKLSDVFNGEEYEKGFINGEICSGKTYDSFYKNNIAFYKKMKWCDTEINIRNDRLYTIYTLISEYINKQSNGIYIPMETMYSRSKVISKNDTCTLYLNK